MSALGGQSSREARAVEWWFDQGILYAMALCSGLLLVALAAVLIRFIVELLS